MAKYLIGSEVTEPTSSKGNKYKRFKVKDESGKITEDVAAFSFYSQYNAIVPGASVEGVLQEKDYNGKKSYSLVDGNLGPKPAGMGGGAKAAVAAKAEAIKKAQENKEESIMISSTARMATEIVIALGVKDKDVKAEWVKWRKWFVDNWENTNMTGYTSAGTKVPDFSEVDNVPVDDINPDDIPF